jgi:hypothetical protein
MICLNMWSVGYVINITPICPICLSSRHAVTSGDFNHILNDTPDPAPMRAELTFVNSTRRVILFYLESFLILLVVLD